MEREEEVRHVLSRPCSTDRDLEWLTYSLSLPLFSSLSLSLLISISLARPHLHTQTHPILIPLPPLWDYFFTDTTWNDLHTEYTSISPLFHLLLCELRSVFLHIFRWNTGWDRATDDCLKGGNNSISQSLLSPRPEQFNLLWGRAAAAVTERSHTDFDVWCLVA